MDFTEVKYSYRELCLIDVHFSHPSDGSILGVHIRGRSGVRRNGSEVPSKSVEEIMRTVAEQYLKTCPPGSKQDFWDFRDYLREVQGLIICREEERSLYITVKCTSLEILEDLWRAYKSGVLNEAAERYLITDEVLKEYELREFTFITVIDEEEYRRCKEELTELEGNDNIFHSEGWVA